MLRAKKNWISEACAYLTKKQVGDPKLWDALIRQIAERRDKTGEYRGEYWGKVMRGAALICKYTGDDDLYRVLEKTVKDMLALSSDKGISSYKEECEFTGWDVWCRKYIAVGLEYFYDICRSDKMKQEILSVLTRHLRAIMNVLGEGKKGIADASLNWGGLNSCSILKAYVVAYELTGEKDLLDFASYIVKTGGSKDFDFLQAAKENVLPLCAYRYPKAYEATSFFEGLIEYGKVTENADILGACENYANAILKEEFTVVGSGGCAVECFNYSAIRQTDPRTSPQQETCVTVSYMLYFSEMYRLTGKSVYLDAMEKSFYNAYLGALNEISPYKTRGLPIDWYSPLVGGHRANIIVGGMQHLAGGGVYSCCTAMGPAGAGVFANLAASFSDDLFRFNFYENNVYRIGSTVVTEKTDYPASGKIDFVFSGEDVSASLTFRIPSWCKGYRLILRDEEVHAENIDGFVTLSGIFRAGDVVTLSLDMPFTHTYIASARFRGGFLVFSKGPVVYAADRRYASIFKPFTLSSLHKPAYDFTYQPQIIDSAADAVTVKCKNRSITLINYASAGSTYDIGSAPNVFIPYRTASPKNVIKCFFDRRRKINT